SWTLPAAGDVTLSLFDVRGRRVASRRFGHLPAGTARASLASLAPSELASGVYVLELRRGDGAVETARVTLVR
ncbi:MAG: T9SS type A sorting domain-containing protein, partial [bacterium]